MSQYRWEMRSGFHCLVEVGMSKGSIMLAPLSGGGFEVHLWGWRDWEEVSKYAGCIGYDDPEKAREVAVERAKSDEYKMLPLDALVIE